MLVSIAGVVFSKEPNNLYNLHSYKHFGLGNKKAATIKPAGKDQSVLLATTRTKKQNKPSSLLNKSVMKKEFCRMAKAVANQVGDNLQARFKEASPCKVERCELESQDCQVSDIKMANTTSPAVKQRSRECIGKELEEEKRLGL